MGKDLFHFDNILLRTTFCKRDKFFSFAHFRNFVTEDIRIGEHVLHFNFWVHFRLLAVLSFRNRYIKGFYFLLQLILSILFGSLYTGVSIGFTSLVYSRLRLRTTLPIFLNLSIALERSFLPSQTLLQQLYFSQVPLIAGKRVIMGVVLIRTDWVLAFWNDARLELIRRERETSFTHNLLDSDFRRLQKSLGTHLFFFFFTPAPPKNKTWRLFFDAPTLKTLRLSVPFWWLSRIARASYFLRLQQMSKIWSPRTIHSLMQNALSKNINPPQLQASRKPHKILQAPYS